MPAIEVPEKVPELVGEIDRLVTELREKDRLIERYREEARSAYEQMYEATLASMKADEEQ